MANIRVDFQNNFSWYVDQNYMFLVSMVDIGLVVWTLEPVTDIHCLRTTFKGCGMVEGTPKYIFSTKTQNRFFYNHFNKCYYLSYNVRKSYIALS